MLKAAFILKLFHAMALPVQFGSRPPVFRGLKSCLWLLVESANGRSVGTGRSSTYTQHGTDRTQKQVYYGRLPNSGLIFICRTVALCVCVCVCVCVT